MKEIYQSLDEIESLLNRTLSLARRAAAADCGDAERMLLQQEFAYALRWLDRKADNYYHAVEAVLPAEKSAAFRPCGDYGNSGRWQRSG